MTTRSQTADTRSPFADARSQTADTAWRGLAAVSAACVRVSGRYARVSAVGVRKIVGKTSETREGAR